MSYIVILISSQTFSSINYGINKNLHGENNKLFELISKLGSIPTVVRHIFHLARCGYKLINTTNIISILFLKDFLSLVLHQVEIFLR